MGQDLAIINNRPVTLVEIRRDRTRYPRIKEMQPQTAVAQLSDIIFNALLYTGRSKTDIDVTYTATGLYNELIVDEMGIGMGNITIEEIGRAVKKAVLGQGATMYGINVSSLYQVIADYCKGEGHTADAEARKQERMQIPSGISSLIDVAAQALITK